MIPDTFINRFIGFFTTPIYKIEYLFAKRWLNKTFGTQEFWGDYISDLMMKEIRLREVELQVKELNNPNRKL